VSFILSKTKIPIFVVANIIATVEIIGERERERAGISDILVSLSILGISLE